MGGGFRPNDTGHMGWGMFDSWVFWLLIVVAVAGWFAWFVKGSESSRPATEERTVAQLKERYARGEIDADEYRRILKEISEP